MKKQYSAQYVENLKNRIRKIDAMLQRLDHFVVCSDGVLRPVFGDSQVMIGYEDAPNHIYTAKELRVEVQNRIADIRKISRI